MWGYRGCYDFSLPWSHQRLSKEALTTRLVRISPLGQLKSCDFESPEDFAVTVKCKLEPNQPMTTYGEFAGDWVEQFSRYTSTNWQALDGFTKLKRSVYRKIFICRQSQVEEPNVPAANEYKTECKAKITFRVVKKDIGEDLNMTIAVRFRHSHAVFEEEVLSALKVAPETDLRLQEYLDMDCTGPAAKFYHELTLIDEHGDNPEVMANPSLNPSLRHVTYLVSKMKKEGHFPRLYHEVMRERKPILAQSGITLTYSADEECVTLITPTMRRTITDFGLLYVFLDTTQIPGGPLVTYLLVPTPIGALPVACCIHDLQRSDFAKVCMSLKLALGLESLTDFNPAYIMINNSAAEKCLNIATNETKNSKKVWAQYEMDRAVWTWLNDDDNKIDKEKTHQLMVDIRKFLRSNNKETAEQFQKDLLKDPYVASNPSLTEFVEELWKRHKDWLCDGDTDILHNNLVELSIRFLREFFMQRCKAFNISLTVEVVAKILENHHRQVINSYIQQRDITKTYTKFLSKATVTSSGEGNTLTFDGLEVKRIGEHEFHLGRAGQKHLTLRTDTMLCNCLYGTRGGFCAHLGAILNNVTDAMPPLQLSKEDVLRFTHVAGKVNEAGELQPEERVSAHESDDHDEFDVARDARGVAVPLHDARHLLPMAHGSDDEYEDEMERDIRDRHSPLRVRFPPMFEPFARIPDGPEDRRFHYFRQGLLGPRYPPEGAFDIPFGEEDFVNGDAPVAVAADNANARQNANASESAFNLAANDNATPSTWGGHTNDAPSTSTGTGGAQSSYAKTLGTLNEEFRRVHKFFSENQTEANLETMTRLTEELSKIRLVEVGESKRVVLDRKPKAKPNKRRHSTSSESNSSDSC